MGIKVAGQSRVMQASALYIGLPLSLSIERVHDIAAGQCRRAPYMFSLPLPIHRESTHQARRGLGANIRSFTRVHLTFTVKNLIPRRSFQLHSRSYLAMILKRSLLLYTSNCTTTLEWGWEELPNAKPYRHRFGLPSRSQEKVSAEFVDKGREAVSKHVKTSTKS